MGERERMWGEMRWGERGGVALREDVGEVRRWGNEEVGESEEVGGSEEVGESEEVGGERSVGESEEVGGERSVGGGGGGLNKLLLDGMPKNAKTELEPPQFIVTISSNR